MPYPANDKLIGNIKLLFGDESERAMRIFGLLRPDHLSYLQQEPINSKISYLERGNDLRNMLEGWVDNMANSIEELNSGSETRRLRDEGIGILLVMREIYEHLPELFEMENI